MRAVSPTKNKRRVEKSETQTLNKKKAKNPKRFSPRSPAAFYQNNDTKTKHASPRECEINRERERERKK